MSSLDLCHGIATNYPRACPFLFKTKPNNKMQVYLMNTILLAVQSSVEHNLLLLLVLF